MVVSKSRSSASLTVIAPVQLMANGRLPSLSPSVLPAVIDQVSRRRRRSWRR